MKYVIYLRVSTEQQAISGLGIEAQRQICMGYIDRNSNGEAQSVLEFMDDGYCGALSLDKRPALLKCVSMLESSDVLLIAKRDRIGRDPIVNAMIERAVQRKKARLISASGDVSDANDPTSILMKRMVDAFAEYERLIIGARTKAALQVKKQRGERVGHIQYGCKLGEDGIHIQVDEKETEILGEIMAMRALRMSYRQIAKELNDMLLYNRAGKNWTHVSITRVIKNGWKVHGDKPSDD